MRIEKIRHITKKEEMYEIFSNIFMHNDVSLKFRGVNIKVTLEKIEDGKLYVRVPDIEYRMHSLAIFTRKNEDIYFAYVVPHDFKDNIFVFEPEGLEVCTASRKEPRLINNKAPIETEVFNILSFASLEHSFKHNTSRLEWFREEIKQKIGNRFDFIKIFFAGDKKYDSRMRWAIRERRPLFIPTILTKQDGTDTRDYSSYMNEIYYNDPVFVNSDLNSEIIMPLFYKGVLPFGYVQANSINTISRDEYLYLKRIAFAFSESISNDHVIFLPSSEKIQIADLSSRGISIVFHDKNLLKHFREGELLLLKSHLLDKEVLIICTVANINQFNSSYRVGCSIDFLDSNNYALYHEFIGEI